MHQDDEEHQVVEEHQGTEEHQHDEGHQDDDKHQDDVEPQDCDEHRDLEDISVDILERMFAVHVTGSFLCAKAVVPDMKLRRYGKIINISSIWGMTGHHTASHYCAAKSAMLGATKSWAKEFAPDNIHVNAVAPGGVLTPMPIKVQGMEKIRDKEKKVPLGRWATPEEISYSVAFLASSESDFITGQVISPNGGETIVGY